MRQQHFSPDAVVKVLGDVMKFKKLQLLSCIIPKDQPLAATEYVEKRRQAALDRGLGEKMAAARAAKKAKQTGE